MDTPDIAALLAKHFKCDMEWSPSDEKVIEAFAGKMVMLGALFTKKHHDYGPGNIAASGELGILVRLKDKIARLSHLRGKKSNNESKEDTWSDIANYAIIALLVRDGSWPDVEDGWDI